MVKTYGRFRHRTANRGGQAKVAEEFAQLTNPTTRPASSILTDMLDTSSSDNSDFEDPTPVPDNKENIEMEDVENPDTAPGEQPVFQNRPISSGKVATRRRRKRPTFSAAPEANEDKDEEEHIGRRQAEGTRPMRFRAPRNARAQTFEIEDGDSQPVDKESLALTQENQLDSSPQRRTSTVTYTRLSIPNDYSRLSPVPATPPRQLETADSKLLTPVRNAQDISQPQGSPSRKATPHRVIYSPKRPPPPPPPFLPPNEKPVESTNRKVSFNLQGTSPSQTTKSSAAATFPRSRRSTGDKARKSSIRVQRSSTSPSETTLVATAEPEFEETKVPFLPARRYVQKSHILAACGQSAPIDWATGGLEACGVLLPEPADVTEQQIGEIESQAGLCKIGEATYSEVFSAQWRYVPRTRYDRFNSKRGSVKGERLMQVALKVIPFGNSTVKSGTGETQTTLRDLYQEIGATLALSRLSERERSKLQEARLQVKMPLKSKERELGANFVKAFRVCICQGPLPDPLLRAWDRWQQEYPDLCENRRPDYYPANQMFAVFVLEMGGETLEDATVSTWKEARSIIRQLALSMALAERHNRFEHRDLHWGNIMVTRYNSNLTFLYQLPPSGQRSKSSLISIPSYRVRCTIIDYTLSRLHIDNDEDADDSTVNKPTNYDPANNVFYVALKDEALFQGQGDIQFDVYRQMRGCSEGGEDWERFYPHTNVLWLTYVLQKILTTKSPDIRDQLMEFAESKLGSAFDSVPPELKRAASQELLKRWIKEFEQCESSSQVLKCALLDLYKN